MYVKPPSGEGNPVHPSSALSSLSQVCYVSACAVNDTAPAATEVFKLGNEGNGTDVIDEFLAIERSLIHLLGEEQIGIDGIEFFTKPTLVQDIDVATAGKVIA